MVKQDLERRIRALEEALDCFSGMEWIIKVGETAALKSVVLEDGAEDIRLAAALTQDALAELDRQIAAAQGSGPLLARRAAFTAAQGLLQGWLAPAQMRGPRIDEDLDLLK